MFGEATGRRDIRGFDRASVRYGSSSQDSELNALISEDRSDEGGIRSPVSWLRFCKVMLVFAIL